MDVWMQQLSPPLWQWFQREINFYQSRATMERELARLQTTAEEQNLELSKFAGTLPVGHA